VICSPFFEQSDSSPQFLLFTVHPTDNLKICETQTI